MQFVNSKERELWEQLATKGMEGLSLKKSLTTKSITNMLAICDRIVMAYRQRQPYENTHKH